MALLIDGYNLLHAAGIFGRGKGGASLHRSREAMLRFLAATIDDAERPRTTVVFDASDAPPGLPRRTTHAEMTVHYASDYRDADELIEQLIALDDAPRSLVVVSSDRRIQRAARRRRCSSIDSDQWYAMQVRRRLHAGRSAPDVLKRVGEPTEAEVAYWVRRFAADLNEPPGPTPSSPAGGPPAANPLDPFPPGYGDDLFDSPE
ncbi:MAG: NYN domain-containing protein [Pirellulales bacterium]|nr:NYN domain-containing protein [Pirellulales bacterium]